MLLTAANTDNRIGEDPGEPKLPGSIENLHRIVSIDKCFRDDEARTQLAHSRLGRYSHAKSIPFTDPCGRTRIAASQRPSPVQ
jgi:hypothetical protein